MPGCEVNSGVCHGCIAPEVDALGGDIVNHGVLRGVIYWGIKGIAGERYTAGEIGGVGLQAVCAVVIGDEAVEWDGVAHLEGRICLGYIQAVGLSYLLT